MTTTAFRCTGARSRAPAWAASLLAGAIAVAGTAAGFAQTQPPEQPPESTFGDEVEVRVVNIEVYVTDRKGRRISGLTRDDFRVFHDSQPVELAHFSRIGGRTRPDDGVVTAELRPSDSGESIRPIEEPVTAVIFVDNSTLTPHHRNRVLEDLEAFVVEQMDAGVRFMIAVYDSGLEILTPVTVDAARAREVLDDIASMPAQGLVSISDRREAMTFIRETYETYEEAGPGTAGNPNAAFLFVEPCLAGWEKMIAAVDAYSQAAGARVGNVQGALVSLTRSLGGIPGRKALLYMSDGLEQRPGLDMYAYLGEICPQREREMVQYMTRWDETPRLEELAEYASAHRVTLYPLETTGLTNYSLASVEFDSRQFSPSTRNDALRASNLQSSLFILAEQTGGQAFLNANYPATDLQRMAADFTDYYSLGIVPPGGWDGATHQIRVELVGEAAKGASLRYRQRYRAVPEVERLAERTLATLVFGWEENPLATEIRLGEQTASEDPESWTVPVEILVPVDELGSVSPQDRTKQLVRVLMIAEDERGRRTAMREKMIPLVAIDDAETGSSHSVVVHLDLAEGEHAIAVAVRDEINRVTSFHRTTVSVGDTIRSANRND